METVFRVMAFAAGVATIGTALLMLGWLWDGTLPRQMPITLTATIAAGVMLVTGFVFWRVER